MPRDPHKSRRDLILESRRECSQKHTNLDETHIYIQQSRRDSCNTLASRRDMCYNHLVLTQSRRAMYDDYDLDYTYCNDYGQDLDEYTQELDEEYARDAHDLEALAYKHYA